MQNGLSGRECLGDCVAWHVSGFRHELFVYADRLEIYSSEMSLMEQVANGTEARSILDAQLDPQNQRLVIVLEDTEELVARILEYP